MPAMEGVQRPCAVAYANKGGCACDAPAENPGQGYCTPGTYSGLPSPGRSAPTGTPNGPFPCPAIQFKTAP